MNIKLEREFLKGFADDKDYRKIRLAVKHADEQLVKKTGLGKEYAGWVHLPSEIEDSFLKDLMRLGEGIRKNSDCLVSIGIGGSYIGIRASLEFLVRDQKIPVYYAGNNLSAGAMAHMLNEIKDKRVTVVVISKSGTTTEPALAFRVIEKFMQDKYSAEELKERIICVTDKQKGALRKIAQNNGYRTFVIPDDVGGRFSILTPVGLVPLAIAGIDIQMLVGGARKVQAACAETEVENNPVSQYAATRYLLYRKGRVIEAMSVFYQRMVFITEWWKQLFGESEGKDGQGIFPASLNFTADLHSMGQLLQEGQRNMFETFLIAEDPGYEVVVPQSENDLDNFNCVAGKNLDYVNKQAYRATAMAHYEGKVPNMAISVPRFDADTLGQLYYFFERAVGISGYLLGVNPFNQPGVEAYKKKMFELLGRK